MHKKTVALVMSALMLVMGALPSYAAATPTIAAAQVTAAPGTTAVVPVTLTGNAGICGATISVQYDSRLTLTDVNKGDALSTLTLTKPGNLAANPVHLVWDGMDADATNGTLALLTFTVPDEAGTFAINLSYMDGDIVDGSLSPVEVTLQNGAVTTGSAESGGEDPPVEPGDGFTIRADAVTATAGGSVDVPVRIANNTGICGATISVQYDSRLTLTDVSKGDALSTLTLTKPGNLAANPVNLVWDGMDADATNGILATLTFTAPNEAGTFAVSLSYTDGDIVDGTLSPIDVSMQNGAVTVSGSSQESGSYAFADASFAYDGAAKTVPGVVYTVDGTPQPALPAGVTATYSIDGETYTDALTVTEGGVYTVYAKIKEAGKADQFLSATLTVSYVVGDVNSDNTVNLLDAGKMTQKIAMWSVSFTETQAKAGARVMTPYDTLTTADVVALLQYLAGWPGITFGSME